MGLKTAISTRRQVAFRAPARSDLLPHLAIGTLAGLLFLTPVVFWPGCLEPFEACKVSLIHLAALVLLILAGLAALATPQSNWPIWCSHASLRQLLMDPISLAVLLCALSALLSTILSISPLTSLWGGHGSALGLDTALSLLALYFATRIVSRRPIALRILLFSVAFAIVPAALYALVQVAGLDPLRWEETSPFAGWTRPIGTLGHPNSLAGYLVMAVPLVVWLAQQQRREGRSWLARGLAVLALLACLVVVASLSRAAWLAGVFAAALMFAGRLGQGRAGDGNPPFRRLRWWVLVPAIAAGACVCVGLFEPVRERLLGIGEMSTRRALWTTAGRMFLAHPWTGAGLDTFDLAFGRYRTPEYWRHEWGVTATRAHNDLLHTLATQGIPGGLAFLLLAGALGLGIVRVWIRREQNRSLAPALAATLAAWYVQNLFGFPVAATACLFVVAAALVSRLAWPDAAGQSSEVRDTRPPLLSPGNRLLQAGLVLAGVWVAFELVVCPFLADCAGQRGDELLAHAPKRALALHESAVRWNPARDVLYLKLAGCSLVAAQHCGDAKEQRCLLEQARQAVERACTLVPISGQNQRNRAAILQTWARVGLAAPEDALSAFDKALTLDPLNTSFLVDAARAALALGRTEQARKYVRRGLEIDPDLAMLHAERAAIALVEKRYGDAQAHLSRTGTAKWSSNPEDLDRMLSLRCVLLLNTGQPGEALLQAEVLLERHADSLPLHRLRAEALEKLGSKQDAWSEYQQILRMQPGDKFARAALARLQAQAVVGGR